MDRLKSNRKRNIADRFPKTFPTEQKPNTIHSHNLKTQTKQTHKAKINKIRIKSHRPLIFFTFQRYKKTVEKKFQNASNWFIASVSLNTFRFIIIIIIDFALSSSPKSSIIGNRLKSSLSIGMARFEINERVKDFVDKKIASRKVVIFSKTTCPFCINAKKIFEEYQIDSNEIESIEIENDPDCSEIQSYLKSITGASTVPRVFINGQCIGGCNDTGILFFLSQTF